MITFHIFIFIRYKIFGLDFISRFFVLFRANPKKYFQSYFMIIMNHYFMKHLKNNPINLSQIFNPSQDDLIQGCTDSDWKSWIERIRSLKLSCVNF